MMVQTGDNAESFDMTTLGCVASVEQLKQNYECVKTKFLKMVEELKMRRVNDADTEVKINTLIKEKFELKKTKDEEITSLQEHCEIIEKENLRLNKEIEKTKKLHEEDKTTQHMSVASASQGIKSLKDEILALQLTKYSLQKKVKDQDHQLQMELRSREELTKKISEYKTSTEEYQQQCDDFNRRMQHLSQLVVKTESMHQKLIENSKHHKCVVDRYEKSINQIKEELIQTKAKLFELEKTKEGQKTELKCKKISADEDSLEIELRAELKSAMQQKQFYVTSLAESNRALSSVQTKYDAVCAQNETLRSDLATIGVEKDKMVEKLQEAVVNKEKLSADLKQSIEMHKNEMEMHNAKLQELISKNLALEQDITKLKDMESKLTKSESSDICTQTVLVLFADCSVQTVDKCDVPSVDAVANTLPDDKTDKKTIVVTDEKMDVVMINEKIADNRRISSADCSVHTVDKCGVASVDAVKKLSDDEKVNGSTDKKIDVVMIGEKIADNIGDEKDDKRSDEDVATIDNRDDKILNENDTTLYYESSEKFQPRSETKSLEVFPPKTEMDGTTGNKAASLNIVETVKQPKEI